MRVHILCVLLSLVVTVACGGSESLPTAPSPTPAPLPPQTTLFGGSLAGPDQSGTLEATIQTAVATAASSTGLQPQVESELSGSLRLAGGAGTVSLDGTYDDSTGRLTLSGGGFVFEGRLERNRSELADTYSGPGGTLGGFAVLNATDMEVTPYCGSFTGEGGEGVKEGVWNMVVADTGRVVGMYVNTETFATGRIGGQLAGTSLTITADEGITANGVLRGNELSGTWEDPYVSGRFSGSTGRCQ